MKITFGTDGWRGIIAKNYTFDNVKICAAALASYLLNKNRKKLKIYAKSDKKSCFNAHFQGAKKGVVVGYDTRFMSDKFAKTTAEVLSSYGIPVFLSETIAPTPAVSWSILQKKASGGVVITASHNPPEYNGFKFKAEYGGSGLPEIMNAIESKINYKMVFKKPRPQIIKKIDLITPYLKQLHNFVDFEKINKLKAKVVVDAMHGASSNLFDKLFEKSKSLKIIPIRNDFNPSFGGVSPEPLDKNLQPLKKTVLSQKADIGFAFDGDGDRIGAYDRYGNFLSSHHIFLILLWHLVKNKKMTGKAVKTFSTSEKVKLLAEKLGTTFIETPIGFKYICELMLSDNILIGGEESGGIGIKGHMPERDAMLCALLMLEAMASSKMQIHEIMDDIYSLAGKFYYERIDLKLKSLQIKNKIMTHLKNNPPKLFAGEKIKELKTLDGVKYMFDDNSWILFRPSGTEPLLRVYAETGNHKKTLKYLEQGVNYVHSI